MEKMQEIDTIQKKIEHIIQYTPYEWREKQPGVHEVRIMMWDKLNALKKELLNGKPIELEKD